MRSFNDKKAENNAKDPSGEMLVKDPKEYYFSGMKLSDKQYNVCCSCESIAPDREMLEKVRMHNAKTHTSLGACILLFMLFTALGIALSGIAETAGIFAPIIEKFSILTISPLVSPAISAVIVILIVRLENRSRRTIAEAIDGGRYHFFRCTVGSKGFTSYKDEDGWIFFTYYAFLGKMAVRTDEERYEQLKDGDEAVIVIVDTDSCSRAYFPSL